MTDNLSPETIQILELHKNGATIEQISQAMGKDPIVVGMLLKARVDTNRKLTLEERFGDLKELAINTLKDVAQYGDNDSARVSAAKILIDEIDGNNGHGGAALKFNYEEFAERVAVARQRVDAVRLKQVETKLLEEPAKVIVAKEEEVVSNIKEFPSVKENKEIEFELVNNTLN